MIGSALNGAWDVCFVLSPNTHTDARSRYGYTPVLQVRKLRLRKFE